jgi:hypothetical protein
MDLPALAAHLAESSREGWRHRAHQVVHRERVRRPVDAAIRRRAAPEVLTRYDRLRPARRGVCEQRRQRARQHALGRHCDLGVHLAGIVVHKDRHGLRVNDVTGVGALHHVVQRRAGLVLAAQDRPVDRCAAAVFRQQRAVHIERAAPRALQQRRAEQRTVIEGEHEIRAQLREQVVQLRLVRVARRQQPQPVVGGGGGDAGEPGRFLRIVGNRDHQRDVQPRRDQRLQTAHPHIVIGKDDRPARAHSAAPRTRCGGGSVAAGSCCPLSATGGGSRPWPPPSSSAPSTAATV